MKHPFFLLLAFFQTTLFSQEFFQLDLASAPQDGVYVGGYFNGGLILPDSTVLGVPLDNQIQNYFITRYSDSGMLEWVRMLPLDTTEYSYNNFPRTKIESSSSSGDVFICGGYKGFIGFDDSTSFSQSIYARSGFVAKYNSLGDLVWSLIASGEKGAHINGYSSDEEGNLYVTGQFKGGGSLKFGDFPPLYKQSDKWYTWLGKVSPAGSVEWLDASIDLPNLSGSYLASDIEIGESGDIYLLINSHSVIKMDSSEVLWVKSIKNGFINDIEAMDSSGIVMVGGLSGSASWDNAPIVSSSFLNSFIMMVDSNGGFERIHTPSHDTLSSSSTFPSSFAYRVERVDSTGFLMSGHGENVFFPPYSSGTSHLGYSTWLDSSFSANCTNIISSSPSIWGAGFERHEIQPIGSSGGYYELEGGGGPASDMYDENAWLNRVDDTCGTVWTRRFMNIRSVASIDDETNSFISLFPNPATDRFEIGFATSQSGRFSVNLLDLHGKVIVNISAWGHEFPLTMNLPDMPSGMYIVLVEGERFQTREKLIVR